jgi:glyoxylase-like metal-dependent hydrolase (beta-lactamase superfamily II)
LLKIIFFDPVTRFELARTLRGRGRYWTTCYLVDGMLVDTGCAFTAPELVQALGGKPLVRIVNTHTHEDHIGANGVLQRGQTGLEILAHPLALPVLSDPRHTQPLHPYRRLFWGWPEPSLGQAVSDKAFIETEHYTFQVLYTPGHSQDHLCLYEARQGWLFTGDLFVGGHDRALRASCDVWQIIASLKRIASLPATRLFPGSARVRDNPASELSAKIAYLEEYGQKVLELNRQGSSVGDIARKLFGGLMWVEVVTLGHFSRHWLVKSYLSNHADPGAGL